MRATIFLLIFLLMGTTFVQAQPPVSSPVFPYNKEWIGAQLLAGFWESADSIKNRIEFVDSAFEMVLKSSNDRPYYFTKDSLNQLYRSRYFPNWPPYECELKMVAPDTLQIVFSQIGVTAYKNRYVKLKK